MQIVLKLSALSKRVILFEYKNQTTCNETYGHIIQLFATDPLLYQITCKPPYNRKEFTTLNTTLEFNLPSSKATTVCAASGIVLHKLHKIKMCTEIFKRLENDTVNLTTAVRDWLNRYGVEEDDYSFETAIKTFYRYKKQTIQQKMSKSGNTKNIFVPTFSHFLTPSFYPLSLASHQTFINHLLHLNTPYFLTQRRQPKKRRIRQLELYVLKNIHQLHYNDIVVQYSISKTALFLNVRKFSIFLKNTPNFRWPADGYTPVVP